MKFDVKLILLGFQLVLLGGFVMLAAPSYTSGIYRDFVGAVAFLIMLFGIGTTVVALREAIYGA